MSIFPQMTNSLSKRLLSTLAMLGVSALVLVPLVEAFQVRQDDNLRSMQSKPFAQSTNFRVNADMFIQPSLTIRSANLVAQAPASSPVLPTPSPTPSTSGGSGGTADNDGGEKYDASDWVLSRKYEQLVRERDERFLTSAPEDQDYQFGFDPTDPGLVDTIDFYIETKPLLEEGGTETESLIPDDSVPQPQRPSPASPTGYKVAVFDQAQFAPDPEERKRMMVIDPITAEQLLITTPVRTDGLMVVELSTKQKRDLIKAQADRFYWPWEDREAQMVEAWLSSAPTESTAQAACINCEDVLWWTWCKFVVLALFLLLIIGLSNTLLLLVLVKYRQEKYQPDNPRSLKYKLKKTLQNMGLLAVMLFSVGGLEAQAQTTTTPQLLIYEGELLDELGAPATGNFTFRFSFWDNGDYDASDVVGGVLNVGAPDYRGWTEVQTTATLTDGSFSLQLSEVTPFTAGLFDQDNLYLQVEVKSAGDPDTAYEFVDIDLADATVDRKIIASVPFAFNANKLDYRDLGFGSGNIPYLDIAGLLPESVIPDLNLTADDLDLTDITLSDFANDLALNDGQVLIGDVTNTATPVTITGDGTLDNTGIFTLAIDSVGEDELDFGNVTLSDFTNDAGFITSVETGDITNGTILAEDLNLGDITLTDFTNDAGFVTSDNDTLGGLTCAANEIAKWDGVAWICAADAGGSAYTASNGITLTGSNFTNDFGTSIGTAEIEDGAVTVDKIGGAGVDQVLTSDALGNPQWEDRSNFAISSLTTDNIFIGNGAGVATAFAVTGDLTMTGGNFQIAPGAVGSAEIATDSIDGTKISLAGETAGDLIYFDGADWIRLGAGTAGQVLQVNATADAPEWSAAAAGDFAGLSDTNFAGLSAGDFAIFNGTEWVNLPASGDITIDATGVATINANAITGAEILDGSVDFSDDTNFVAGSGLTLVGDTLSADLGSSIDSSEIEPDTITEVDIAANAVTASELADNAVDTLALQDDAVTADKIDLTDVTLSDFTNDAGFVTTDNDTTYTAGAGLTLVGTQFNATLGTDISTGEIQDSAVTSLKIDNGSILTIDLADDAVTTAKIGGGGANQVLTTDGAGNSQWEDKSTFAIPSLSANNIFVGNGMGVATDTAVSGDLTMSAGNFQIAPNAVDSAEIADDAVGESEIDFANVTLSDFTNDAGFLSTVDISDDTNLIAGTGATLIGDTLSVNLGNTIEGSEITDETITDNDLDLADITLNDFTNDAGFLTTVDISANTNLAVGSGLTLIGDSIISDLGSTITSGEIQAGTITDTNLNLASITLNDFTNDAGFLSTVDISDDTNLTAGTGLTLTGDSLSVDLGDSISTSEIETNAVGDDAINYTQVTLSDFTNDAGFITSSSDTLADLSCGINEIAKYNGANWVCAADAGGTSYTATDGITLTGAVFTNDFSTSIESNEITDGTILDDDLDLTDITLADFTNDAGFVTSDTLAELTCAAGEIARWNGTAWECAGEPIAVTKILSPRYPNSIFEADGTNNTGSMFEEDETLVGGFLGTFLRWFSRQTVLHDYDIIVEWAVPDDFDNFQTPGFSLDYRTDGTALDAAIDMIVQRNNDGIDELSASGMGLNSNAWTTANLTLNGATTWVPGDTMKIRMRMKARNSSSASVGNIKISYNRK